MIKQQIRQDTAFALADLQRHGVETSLLEEVRGLHGDTLDV